MWTEPARSQFVGCGQPALCRCQGQRLEAYPGTSTWVHIFPPNVWPQLCCSPSITLCTWGDKPFVRQRMNEWKQLYNPERKEIHDAEYFSGIAARVAPIDGGWPQARAGRTFSAHRLR